jgi:glycosyltransferase involved in cell wall biosynthesis
MRIAYLCYWDAYGADGVSRKVTAQTAAWRDRGHDVEVFCLTPPGRGEPFLRGRLFPAGSVLDRVRATARLARAARAWRPDVLYVRLDLWAPPVLALARRVPTVVEVNGYDEVPVHGLRRLVRLVRRLGYRVLLGGARGLVVVTPGLVGQFRAHGKPIAVVTNGIELASIEALPHRAGARPRLVFVGSDEQPWQGTDKLVELARLAPELDVDVVGIDARRLPDGLPENVTVHGWLDRVHYAGLLAAADVGVGPLALHRKGLEEAASLKVREYLAYGLPVVLAGKDGDFVGDEPWFLLRLPNVEDNIVPSLDRIRAFVAAVRGRRVERAAVADRIDAAVKEQRRLDFFAEVAR